MKLIVGLGNPGEKYAKTRHNVGFMVVDKFLKSYETAPQDLWSLNDKLKSEIAIIDWQPKEGKAERVILSKPQTYMNNSGMAVSLIASYYKIPLEDIWVVYDELDLPTGSMKIRFGGAAAGHHGAESIIEKLGTDKFWRFRMGLGHESVSKEPEGDVEDYVLGGFSGSEKGKAKDLLKHGSASLEHALEKGLQAAMNRYNTK